MIGVAGVSISPKFLLFKTLFLALLEEAKKNCNSAWDVAVVGNQSTCRSMISGSKRFLSQSILGRTKNIRA